MLANAGRILTVFAFGAILSFGASVHAQTAPPASAPAAPAASAPAASAPASPAPAATPPSAAAQPTDAEAAAQPIEIKARPAIVVSGSAKWEDGYKEITAALAKAREALARANAKGAGLKEAGRPMAAFVDTDDDSFKFQAMIPLEAPAPASADLGPDAKAGETPAGRAIKFQHRGAYDDVDATYEAITAYLDEKGYEAQNVFVEEYVNDPKGQDDSALEIAIYVFIK
ncbi:MAG: GyrI-like domain-containing protein [Rhodoblastus sp.]